VKLLLGIGEPLIGRLLVVDALSMRFRVVRIHKDPSCPVCGTHEIRELIDYDQFCSAVASAESNREEEIAEITPRDLADRLAGRSGPAPLLIDVREPYEADIARIPGARLIPLGELERALPDLDKTRETVVHCRSGMRSARAVRQLQAAGFRKVLNLSGGILRWSDDVDPAVPKY